MYIFTSFFFAIDSRFICIILYAYWPMIHSILHFLASSASFLKSKSVSQLCWGIIRIFLYFFFSCLKETTVVFGQPKSIHSPFSQISSDLMDTSNQNSLATIPVNGCDEMYPTFLTICKSDIYLICKIISKNIPCVIGISNGKS